MVSMDHVPTPATWENAFMDTLEEAQAKADRAFAAYVRQYVTSPADRNTPPVSLTSQDVAQVDQQRLRLMRRLGNVSSPQELSRALFDYAEDEIARLYFFTNDETQAQLGLDYLQHYVKEALPLLAGRGKLTPEEADEINAIVDYYALLIDAYQMLRAEVRARSQGATDRLTELAMMAEDVPEDIMSLVFQGKTEFTPEEIHSIETFARRTYEEILTNEKLDIEEGSAHPSLLWIKKRANHVAGIELVERGLSGKAATAAYNHRVRELVGMVDHAVTQRGDLLGLLHSKIMLEDMECKVAGVPDYMGEIIQNALGHAQEMADMQTEAAWREHVESLKKLPVAQATKELRQNLWRGMGTLERATDQTHDMQVLIENNLAEQRSMISVARRADAIVNQVCEDVFLGCDEPSNLLYLRNYLGYFRQSLGEELLDAGCFDTNRQALVQLKEAEEKCQHLHDSFVVTKGMMLEMTDGAYDSPFSKAYMHYAAETGHALANLSDHDVENDLKPLAAGVLTTLLKNMEIYRQDQPYILPLLYKRANDVVLRKHPQPAPDDIDAMNAWAETVMHASRALYHQTIRLVKKPEGLYGPEENERQFYAPEVRQVMELFDDQERLATKAVRRH